MKKLAPLIVVMMVALWSVWPVVVKPARVADYGYDGWFINWVINRQVKIISGCVRTPTECKNLLWQGNIYYPYKNTLAYSELFFLDAMTAYIPVFLSNNPAIANGWVMALGQVATMLIIYFWFREITKNSWGAVIGSVAFGLSQVRWEYQVHLQLWSMQWWLLGTWLVVKWVKGDKWVKGVVGAVLLGMQAWQSVLPVYFAFATIIANLIFNVQYSMFNKINKLLLVGLIAGIIAWPVVKVYSEVSKEMGFVRTIREAAHGGISLDDLGSKFYSPGLYLLLIVSVLKLLKSQILNSKSQINFKIQNSNTKFFLLVLLAGLVMALGPTLKWQGKTVKIAGYPVPMPYAVAYYTVPGLQSMRTVSRWMWLAGFGMSGIIAIGFSRTSPALRAPSPNPLRLGSGRVGEGNRKSKIYFFGILGCLVVAIVGGTHLVKYRELPGPEKFPKVYKWLKEQSGEVILELPKGGEDVELQRMYYSWMHDKKLVNGYSGFAPLAVEVKPDYVIMHHEDGEAAVYRVR